MAKHERFSGRSVVISGAASGIGAETARLFASEGAIVFAADIDDDAGAALVEDWAEKGEGDGEIRYRHCDVCDPAQIAALIDGAAQECGGIDILFNNAGAGGAREPIDEIDAAGWDRTMDLLLRSVAMGIRFAVPHMIGRKHANIVNVSSVAAIGPGYAPTAYAVAKAGVLHLTRCAATDLARHGIRVNAVQPGFINTNIFTAGLDVPEQMKRTAKAMIAQMSADAQPVARGGQSRDIAEAVAYLASPAAEFVTGQSIVVDGGLTLGPRHSWDPETPGLFDSLKAMAEQAGAKMA